MTVATVTQSSAGRVQHTARTSVALCGRGRERERGGKAMRSGEPFAGGMHGSGSLTFDGEEVGANVPLAVEGVLPPVTAVKTVVSQLLRLGELSEGDEIEMLL